MAEKYNQQSTLDRLTHSKKARAAALVASLAGLSVLAGCAGSSAPSGSKAKAVTVGTRTPGATPPTAPSTAPSTAPPIRTSPASRANWCNTTSTIVEGAFVDPNAPSECEVMPVSSTPGDVLIKWTLDAAGVQGFSVEASVLNAPFRQFTGAAKPTSGSGTEYVIIPNSSIMYVEVPGNPQETGELEVLTGENGAIPLGIQNSLASAAGLFAVFGSTPNANLYPAGTQ